jgi:aspartate aminotransferase
MGNVISDRSLHMNSTISGFLQFNNVWERWSKVPEINDFGFGNPHELAMPEYSQALEQWIAPKNNDWFAYKMSEPEAVNAVVETLRRLHHMPFEQQDVFMTNGAFAALAVALGTITDPGDEIIYISPPWFFYEMLISSYRGVPVRVRCDARTFDLDIESIERAITPRTRGIIVNSPNNPTGKIYPPETLAALAERLERHSRKNGRTIYLLSDESYNRIVYDGRSYPSPAVYYPNSFILYTYGKTLLTPGQRIGYIALPPGMPQRELVRQGVFVNQMATGFAFPNALLQHALGDLEKLSIDIDRLQVRRDRMVAALQEMGYDLHKPEGTFYLLVRSPQPDDLVFAELLTKMKVLVLPGSVFEMPGYFRISLTASDEMVERALPAFAAAIDAVRESEQAKTGEALPAVGF